MSVIARWMGDATDSLPWPVSANYPATGANSRLMVLSTDLYSSKRVRGNPAKEYSITYSRILDYYPQINYTGNSAG